MHMKLTAPNSIFLTILSRPRANSLCPHPPTGVFTLQGHHWGHPSPQGTVLMAPLPWSAFSCLLTAFSPGSLPPPWLLVFRFFVDTFYPWVSLVALTVKNPPAMRKTWFPSLGWEDPLEEIMGTHENPHGQRSLVGYNPWGCKESDTTEWLHFHSG